MIEILIKNLNSIPNKENHTILWGKNILVLNARY